MSNDSLISSLNTGQRFDILRNSYEDTVNLNDDLVNESSVTHGSPELSRRGSGSAFSFRNSTDLESTISFSPYFQGFNEENGNDTPRNDQFSPLGPNSIYELTISSDSSRVKKGRPPRSSVALNGGNMIINNLRTPTTRDIPPVHLLKLKRRVQSSDLENLYANVEEDYKSFERSYKMLTKDSLQILMNSNRETDRVNHTSSKSSASSVPYPLHDFSSIPDVFKEAEFRLDNPSVFKQVFGNSKIISLEDNSESQEEMPLIDNFKLQEKFSEYLAVMEDSLIHEISKRSDSFFNAIDDIKEVQSSSENCSVKFQKILIDLKYLELNNSKKALEIVQIMKKRKRIEKLEYAILQIKYVQSILNLATISYENEDYSKCLRELNFVDHLIRGKHTAESGQNHFPRVSSTLIDLSSLLVLADSMELARDIKFQCGEKCIHIFVNALIHDLKEHCDQVSQEDTLTRFSAINTARGQRSIKINTSYQVVSDKKKSELKKLIQDLCSSESLTQAFRIYQESIIVEIKAMIKLFLPISGSEAPLVDISNNNSRSSSLPPESSNVHNGLVNKLQGSLSSSIKSMGLDEFEEMLRRIFSRLSECLRRLTSQQKVLLDLALTVSSDSNNDNVDVMILDISLTIEKAIELTQVRVTKVINVMLEQLADLPLNKYLQFYALVSAYIQECELINPGFSSDSSRSTLNSWLKNHIGYFVHRYYLNAMVTMSKECEKECWKEVTNNDELSEYQLIINELIGYMTYLDTNGERGFSGKAWLGALNLLDSSEKVELSDKEQTPSSAANSGRLFIDDQLFMVPRLVFLTLLHTKDFYVMAKVFSTKYSLIVKNVLSYYRLLNTRISQAILNAGATRTAGLKHITTKHIALCIQLIEFYISFLTKLQALSKDVKDNIQQGGQDILTFEKLIDMYKDHENELFSKVVSIMYDRTNVHCANILKIDFSQPLNPPQQCHAYMDTLVKETSTVTRVLSKYLPEVKRSLILLQIFDGYKKLLVECYCTKLPRFKDFNEKYTLLKDIDYFRVKLADLPGYGNSGQIIWENVNAMPTIEDEQMERKMKSNIASETHQDIKEESPQRDDRSTGIFGSLISSKADNLDNKKTSAIDAIVEKNDGMLSSGSSSAEEIKNGNIHGSIDKNNSDDASESRIDEIEGHIQGSPHVNLQHEEDNNNSLQANVITENTKPDELNKTMEMSKSRENNTADESKSQSPGANDQPVNLHGSFDNLNSESEQEDKNNTPIAIVQQSVQLQVPNQDATLAKEEAAVDDEGVEKNKDSDERATSTEASHTDALNSTNDLQSAITKVSEEPLQHTANHDVKKYSSDFKDLKPVKELQSAEAKLSAESRLLNAALSPEMEQDLLQKGDSLYDTQSAETEVADDDADDDAKATIMKDVKKEASTSEEQTERVEGSTNHTPSEQPDSKQQRGTLKLLDKKKKLKKKKKRK